MARLIRRPLKRLAIGLVAFVILDYVVLPQIAGARNSLHLLSRVNVVYLLIGLALEAASITAYAKLTESVLPPEGRPRFRNIMRIDLSTLATSHIVPGGSAAGSGVGYRLLTESGVSGTDAGFALATQGLGSAVVLNVILWLGLMVSIPLRGFNPVYGTAAVAGALLLGGFALAVISLTRGEDRLAGVVCRTAARVPFLDPDTIALVLRRVADRLRQLGGDRKLLLRASGWAAANWLLSAASLWVFVYAFGYSLGIDGLIVAFGLANVLAAIPITPGGLGVVEVILTSSLVGFGAPRGIAVLGVVTYRLVNFWLPIPIGAVAYLRFKAEGASARRHAQQLLDVAAESLAEAEQAREWAAERGIRVRPKP